MLDFVATAKAQLGEYVAPSKVKNETSYNCLGRSILSSELIPR